MSGKAGSGSVRPLVKLKQRGGNASAQLNFNPLLFMGPSLRNVASYILGVS